MESIFNKLQLTSHPGLIASQEYGGCDYGCGDDDGGDGVGYSLH